MSRQRPLPLHASRPAAACSQDQFNQSCLRLVVVHGLFYLLSATTSTGRLLAQLRHFHRHELSATVWHLPLLLLQVEPLLLQLLPLLLERKLLPLHLYALVLHLQLLALQLRLY